MISVLNGKLRKLLDLYYADSISDATFAAEEKRLNAQLSSMVAEAARSEDQAVLREHAAEQFDQVSELLTNLDLESIWEQATESERRTLVEDLVDSIHIHPDHLSVQVARPTNRGHPGSGGTACWYQTCRVGGGT